LLDLIVHIGAQTEWKKDPITSIEDDNNGKGGVEREGEGDLEVQVIQGPGLLASHENDGLVYSVGAEQAETVELTPQC
jgi:hypothetical protein